MEDLGVQLWRAGRIQGLDAEAQMFAQGNMLQTFANCKEILPKVRGSERFKGEKRTDCYKISRNTVRFNKNNKDLLTNGWV